MAVHQGAQRIERLAGEEVGLCSLFHRIISMSIDNGPLAHALKQICAGLLLVCIYYIFEVVEEVGDSLAFGVGEDIVVVDIGAAWTVVG